jgi:hypothetical protein
MLKKGSSVVLLVLRSSVSRCCRTSATRPPRTSSCPSFSINDTLPPELIGCATTYGGMIYVPLLRFYELRLRDLLFLFRRNATAYLFRGDNQLFFELGPASPTDADDYRYSTPRIMRSGTVYVPLAFTRVSYGGNRYASIPGTNTAASCAIAERREVGADGRTNSMPHGENAHADLLAQLPAHRDAAPQTPVPTSSQIPAVATPFPDREVFPHKGRRIWLKLPRLPRTERAGTAAAQRLRAPASF